MVSQHPKAFLLCLSVQKLLHVSWVLLFVFVLSCFFVNHCNFSLRWESFSKENSSVQVASLITHSEDPITVTIGCLQFHSACAYFVDHNIFSTPQLWELECDLMWGCITEWEDCGKKTNDNKNISEYVTTKTELNIKCATNLRCLCQCSAMVLHDFSVALRSGHKTWELHTGHAATPGNANPHCPKHLVSGLRLLYVMNCGAYTLHIQVLCS